MAKCLYCPKHSFEGLGPPCNRCVYFNVTNVSNHHVQIVGFVAAACDCSGDRPVTVHATSTGGCCTVLPHEEYTESWDLAWSGTLRMKRPTDVDFPTAVVLAPGDQRGFCIESEVDGIMFSPEGSIANDDVLLLQGVAIKESRESITHRQFPFAGMIKYEELPVMVMSISAMPGSNVVIATTLGGQATHVDVSSESIGTVRQLKQHLAYIMSVQCGQLALVTDAGGVVGADDLDADVSEFMGRLLQDDFKKTEEVDENSSTDAPVISDESMSDSASTS